MNAAFNSDAPAPMPRAVSTGAIKFGGAEVDCYNLDDGRRVISQRGVIRGLRGASKASGPGTSDLARYIERLPEKHRGLLAIPVVEFVLPSGTIVDTGGAGNCLFRRDVPEFIADLCTGCMECALVCPDAAIPGLVSDPEDVLATAIAVASEQCDSVIRV